MGTATALVIVSIMAFFGFMVNKAEEQKTERERIYVEKLAQQKAAQKNSGG
jgi:preprotein translocase subunit YajC